MTNLLTQYQTLLKTQGDPNEAYKWHAITHFQKHWDLEASDFADMFLNAFKQKGNLMYQNSWGYIKKAVTNFPDEVRAMFRGLYDESTPLQQRMETFQEKAEALLPKVKQATGKKKLKAQQDERTLSVYLAFRYPEKYYLYKSSYYANLCAQLGVPEADTGGRYLHYMELAEDLKQRYIANNPELRQIHQRIYPDSSWKQDNLILQNFLYNMLEKPTLEPKPQMEAFQNPNTQYWLFAPGESAHKWDEFYNQGIMAIGWDELGDLNSYEDKASINEKLLEVYGGNPNKMNDSAANFEFTHVLKKGDVVIVKSGVSNLLGYGIVKSDYYFDHGREDYKHCRKVDWKLKGKWKSGHRLVLKTLTDITKYASEKKNFNFYYEELLNIMGIEKSPTQKSNSNYKMPLNQILYGPPGTGKTYKLRNEYFPKYIVKEASISKEAYFEETVRDLTWWQAIALALLEQGTSKVNELLTNRWVAAKAKLSESKNVRATLWGNLQMHTVQESNTVAYTQRQVPLIFDKNEDKTWELLDTDLKEQFPELYDILESVNNFKPNPEKEIKHFVFTTFHQSFAYEDFVEGIKPKLNVEGGNSELSYQIENGIFKDLCLRAQSDPENNYAIFIDEINRGNVSAIFGELITLIEPDKRLGATNEIKVRLPYSKTEFGVPENIDIIATMNTADRSVEALDTALRRRFSFKEVMPQPSHLEKKEFNGFNLKEVLETINQRIAFLLDRDHTIGHSYFLDIAGGDQKALKRVFKNKVIPLLQEYFYHDYEKIALILGPGFVRVKTNHQVAFPNIEGIDRPDQITHCELIREIDDIEEAVLKLLNRNGE